MSDNKKRKRLETNNNSNNNTSSNTSSLVFTSNKDTNSGEDAFWKVFRNKFLFKLIFSNFKFKELFSYGDLIGSRYIFRGFSNGDAIIRDKVKSGNYECKDFLDAILIISRITKDTKENREFYRQLFSSKQYHNTYNGDNHSFSNYSFWIQLFANESNRTAFLEYNKLFQVDKKNISVKLIKKIGISKKNLKLLKMKPFLESNGFTVTESLSVYDIIGCFEYSQQFKELIKIYKFIIAENYRPKEKYNDTVQQLNHQLEINQFNTIQLESTIEKISQSNDQYLKPIIHNILKVLYSIYKLKFQDLNLFKPIEYYIFFKEKARFEQVFTYKNPTKTKSKYYNYLFTVINSDSCIEYQKDLVKSVSPYISISERFCIENAIFSSNNLELIDLMFKHFGNSCFFCDYQPYITKTEILDYFFNNHQRLMFRVNSLLWIFVDNKVIDHFEELMKSVSRNFFIKLNPEYVGYPIKDIFERLERALNNPTLYTFESNKDYPTNSINRYKSYFLEHMNYYKQDSAISMLEKHIEKYGISEYFDIEPILNTAGFRNCHKFIHWIFQDLSDQYIESNISNEELTIKSGINTTNNQKYEIKIKRFTSWELLLFYCGRPNILYQNLNSNSQLMENSLKFLFFNRIIRVNLFLNLLDYISKSDLQGEFFSKLLKKAARIGLVSIFKTISTKYEYLYYEKSDISGLSIINNKIFYELKTKGFNSDLRFLSKYTSENNIMYKWEKYNFIYINDYQPALWYIYTLIRLKALHYCK
ncbi:hypothetical protein DICPUDRAFT_81155 [Dictyostelium purpureum]|uniref:Uncharacterized protein n=1 Tax=Dictyostelium purpureum TaxID=5786 RepID=F0ZSN3_DICPU|nr:uncharacterized protein DICPUDRAFT_81155 [Dictyostelium purpureum]EGC33035.1 hypothetical protein DICPUDRAFT_81155 [Dictyostelium purpureum]|eukprot:XP_003290424.1 hypothetical protein DICPUDRAFT_81155 [Dictyostelium purpureum]